jgi:hypothetical protein
MSNFSLEEANNMAINQCREYITKYFYPLNTSQHVMVSYDEDGKPVYEIKEDQTIKKVYFNRLPKDVCDYYFKKYDKIRSLTCELNKPTLFDNYFNTCPSFLHTVKPYDSFSNEIKNKVNIMLDCIQTIWASGDEAQYNYIIKWFANMARGGKNQSVLYLRGDEGIGKSTITDFMMKHVIGSRLSLMSGSGPLLSNFNIILYSKLLVVYEELENFSTSQWQVVSSRIKRDVTSTTCSYEKKNETSFVGKNINNIIINSNVDAIKNDEGRRYFILDLSNEKKGDSKFWDSIYKCMNNEVGEAFFSYLHNVDLTDYHDQAFPSTQAKQDAIVKRLESVAKFIKDDYILRKRDLNCNLQHLYGSYKQYCANTGAKAEHKIEFNSRMTKYKLEGKKSGNDHNKFNYKQEYLVEIATKNKWLHKTDVYFLSPDEVFCDDGPIDDAPLDRGIKDDKDEEIESVKDKEINELKAQVEALKKQMQEMTKPKVVDPVEHLLQSIIELQQQQKEVNELYKRHTKPKEKKPEPPRRIKIDPKVFELDLNELEDLI